MITPIDLKEEDGTVKIARADMNSVGVNVKGLDPYSGFYAGSFCYTEKLSRLLIDSNPDLLFPSPAAGC